MSLKGEVGGHTLNDHGNYIDDHGKIMEKSWNFVFEFLWEPCIQKVNLLLHTPLLNKTPRLSSARMFAAYTLYICISDKTNTPCL